MADDTSRVTAGPPAEIAADGLLLRRWTPGDVGVLCEAVIASRAHLAPWMPWAAGFDRQAAVSFLAAAGAAWDERTEFAWGVWDGDLLVGGAGLHVGPHDDPGDPGGAALQVGYWTHVDHLGRGVARRAAAAVVQAAFALADVEAVEIRHAERNVRSARIPEVLGFRRDREVPRPPDAGGDSAVTVVWRTERGDPLPCGGDRLPPRIAP